MMNYLEILKRAWNITWSHRVLWLFGMFAIALGEIELSRWGLSNGFLYSKLGNPYLMPLDVWEFYIHIGEALRFIPYPFFGLISFIGSLVPLFLWLISLIALIGLIKGSILSLEKSTFDWRMLVKEGRRYFWRSFGSGLLFSIFISIFSFLLSSFAFLLGSSSGDNASDWQVPLFFFAAFVVFFIDVYSRFILVVLVVDDLRLVPAIIRTVKLILQDFAKVAPMHLLLTFFEYAGGFLTRLPLIIAGYPIILSWLTNESLDSGSSWDLLLTNGYSVLLAIALLILVESILHTFTIAGWTITYINLRSETDKPIKAAAA